ncbi:MAG: putative mutT-like protein [Mycobacterium sp.]|nr:putative mutT-like protein [Mycobacterium sp.]
MTGQIVVAGALGDGLVRELREELGIEVTVGARLGAEVALPNGMTMRAYLVTCASGSPLPHDHRALRWVRAADLDGLSWVPADRGWVPDLAAALRV